jgi:hypothetical protein
MRNPNTIDDRDEALGSMLGRAAEGIESTPSDRLPEVIRRGSRRRAGRFGAISAVVAVFVGAISWAGLSLPTEDAVIPANVSDWRTFASLEGNGWTIQVPPPWHVTELPACENAPERIGVLVTNVEFDFRDPRGGPPDCEDRLLFAGFAREGVALGFYPRGVVPGFFGPTLDTVIPLEPDLLIQTDGIAGGPAESFNSVNLGDETIGVIRRFVGPEASSSDVTALDRMLASFRVRGAPQWVAEDFVRGPVRVSLRRPGTWQLSTVPLEFGAPAPIVQLMSPGIAAGGCRVFPWAPWIRLDGLVARGGATVVLSDARASSDPLVELPTRPDRLRFLEAMEERITCGQRVRALRFGFEQAGRPLYLDVAATWDLYRNEPVLLRYILDSIEISEAS